MTYRTPECSVRYICNLKVSSTVSLRQTTSKNSIHYLIKLSWSQAQLENVTWLLNALVELTYSIHTLDPQAQRTNSTHKLNSNQNCILNLKTQLIYSDSQTTHELDIQTEISYTTWKLNSHSLTLKLNLQTNTYLKYQHINISNILNFWT